MQFPRPGPGFISIQFQCTGNLFVSPFHWSISRITFQITIHPSTFFLNFTWIPFHIVPPSRAQQRADKPSLIALFKVEVVLWRMRPTIHLPFLHLPTLIFTIFSSLRIFAFCPKCSVALPTKTSLLGICIGWRCQIFICLGMDANNDIGGCSGRAGGCRWTVLSAPDVENVAAGAPRSRGRGNAEC